MEQAISNNLVCTTSYTVTSADADMNARLKPGALVNFLIQSAIQSADSLGFGFRDLKKHRLFWVLSRLTIEIIKPLSWGQSLKIETWPKDINGLLYLRDFIVYGPGDNVVAKATSGWLAIDAESKRPRQVEGATSEWFTQMKEIHALVDLPLKLSPQPQGIIKVIKPEYSDIDLNKHVTSTRYIDWITDTLPLDFLQNNYPHKMSINYMRETMLGEEVKLTQNQEGAIFLFEGVNIKKETPSFRAMIEF